MRKKLTISKLKHKLDSIFSHYIRYRDDNTCITCGKKDEHKKMQNGHLFSRSYLFLRYNIMNCNCQCYRCNCILHGNNLEYRKAFINEYNEESFVWLDDNKNILTHWKQDWYIEQIKIYQELVNNLKAD